VATKDSETGTVLGARDHARAQATSSVAAAVETRPTIPAQSAVDLPVGVAATNVVWDETLTSGGYASRVVRRGVHLRIAQVEGHTNVSFVLHHAARPIERLNVADTVKLQWNAYPGAGSLLLSDMGRVLATVLDGDGAIDLFCGASLPDGRARLVLGLAKHGLTRRDLPPAANLFTPVRVADDGALEQLPRSDRLEHGTSWADADATLVTAPAVSLQEVVLRAELDLLVTVAVTPHPLDDRAAYTGGPVRLTAWQGRPAGPGDPARTASPEARRAFENTDDVLPTLLTSLTAANREA
jgi:hypothetical protein